MIKKAAFLVLMVVLLTVVGNVSAATLYWLASRPDNSRWIDGNNWPGGAAPLITDGTTTYGSTTPQDGPYIISGDDANGLYHKVGGVGGAGNVGYLTMNGGKLTLGEYLWVAGNSTANRDGEFRMNGGTINLGVTTFSAGDFSVGHGYTGCPNTLTGILRMIGGVINATDKFSIAEFNTNGYVYLDGGTIYAADFTMKEHSGTGTAYMNITGDGKVIITGDRTAVVATYIANGWLEGNGNNYEIQYDYNITNSGKTTIWATAAASSFMYWGGNFSTVALGNIGSRNQICQGSSQATLFTNGNAEITANNTATAQLKSASGDTLVTEYKLTFDGDGDPNTGGATVDWTLHNNFLTTPSAVTHFTGDDEVQVTLWVRASNAAGKLADAGEYTATQTLTASWNP